MCLPACQSCAQKLSVDVGTGTPLTIVTNAPNVNEGSRVVVATVGSLVDDEPVKKTSVGGVVSGRTLHRY